jgi:zinc/manganese transport system substrate-binding protein
MPLKRRHALVLGASALAAGAARAAGPAGPPPRIVASFSILADMARELAPEGTQVTALVGPDADAHVYEPRPADGQRLAQADLVLVNGLGFEGWVDRMVKVSGYRGPVVVASAGIAARQVAGTADPHAWQDLALAQRYAATLHAALLQRWPQHQAELRQRHGDYQARLGRLAQQVVSWLAVVPRAQRRVITSHGAFGYFGDAYGVDFLAAQGWSTHSEPSAAAVARLIRQIQREGVRALFVENISDPRLVQQIARETGAHVGGTLYSDALSQPQGPAPTYLKLIEHNTRTLAAALQA